MATDTFLILGSQHSGRRALCADVCKNALAETKCAVFVSESEPPSKSDLAALENVEVITYADASNISEKIPQETQCVFVIADARQNLADFIEKFKELADSGALRLVRIWSVVDCAMRMREGAKMAPYFDALSHFADCVILGNRAGVPDTSVKELTDTFKKQCKPHLVVFADKFGRVKNPLELTIDETRRISMLFDEFDPVDELDIDEDNLPDEPFSLERKPDPYLERLLGGHRKISLPVPPEAPREEK